MLSESMNLLEIGIKLKNFTGQVNPGDFITQGDVEFVDDMADKKLASH